MARKAFLRFGFALALSAAGCTATTPSGLSAPSSSGDSQSMLAGRYPFAELSASNPEVDWSTVAALLESNNDSRWLVPPFLSQFFAAGKPRAAPVVLKIDRNRSVGEENLLDMRATVGSQLYSLSNPVEFEWVPGDDIELSFRWAENSRYTVAASTEPWSVNDRTASLRYTGSWALFRLLDQFCDTNESPCQHIVLRLATKDTTSKLSDTPTVLVFEIAVLDPVTRQPIRIPELPFRMQ